MDFDLRLVRLILVIPCLLTLKRDLVNFVMRNGLELAMLRKKTSK